LRDNGAIEGAAGGFAEDDEVIVQLKYDKSVAQVVAHLDGVRPCGFRIKITRDGVYNGGTEVIAPTLVTPAVFGYGGLYVRSGDPLNPTGHDIAWEYDEGTGYYNITFTNPAEANDPDGYWIGYLAENTIFTTYPYKYHANDRYLVENKLRPGTYEDHIPYWDTLETPYAITQTIQIPPAITASISVTSSVPYRVEYTIGLNWTITEGVGTLMSSDGVINYTFTDSGVRNYDVWTGQLDAGDVEYSVTANHNTSSSVGWYVSSGLHISAFPV